MKTLHYFFLLLLLPIAVSCVQDEDSIEPKTYTQEEIAYNVLQLEEVPVLFGKVSVDQSGKWESGWILTKYGKVMEVDFSPHTNPVGGYQLIMDQLELMIENGREIFQLDNSILLANHYIDLKDIPATMEIERTEGDIYFAVVEQEFVRPDNIDALGCNNSDSAPFSLFRVKMLATAEEMLDHKEAIEAMSWLNNLENQLH